MFSLRTTATRKAPTLCTQSLKLTTISLRPLTSLSLHRPTPSSLRSRSPPSLYKPTIPSRSYADKTTADDLIEEIQTQYAVARDEFELAAEETEKKTVYAEADREAARDELDHLHELYQEALRGEDGEEVKRRVGQRIRELDNAVEAMEKSAIED